MIELSPNLRRVMILGLGVSGRAAARLATARGLTVEARDSGDSAELAKRSGELAELGVEVRLGAAALRPPQRRPNLVVTSPGIPLDSELGGLARELGCPLVGELEFAAAHVQASLLGVTGSNGKTTTVELTVHCLRQAGVAAAAAGNIGRPLSEFALLPNPPSTIVVEVSSFQLETVRSLRFKAAALLNLTVDHLDRHGDFHAYASAKAKILGTVPGAGQVIMREDLVSVAEFREGLQGLPGRPVLFSTTAPASRHADYFLAEDGSLCRRGSPDGTIQAFADRGDLAMDGLHNVENALAAVALCEQAGVAPRLAAQGLSGFRAGVHRLQTVFVHKGVRVVDDSKATNPDALLRALQTLSAEQRSELRNGLFVGPESVRPMRIEPGRDRFPTYNWLDSHIAQFPAEQQARRIILIAGGLDKDMDFSPVKPWLSRTVKQVLCIGSCRQRLAAQWSDAAPCEVCNDLSEAVALAVASAESGDTVLLSPGCASQDMFADYAERGRVFIETITREIKK